MCIRDRHIINRAKFWAKQRIASASPTSPVEMTAIYRCVLLCRLPKIRPAINANIVLVDATIETWPAPPMLSPVMTSDSSTLNDIIHALKNMANRRT